MITADKVKNQIQSLINTANEKTGNNDATLTSAVGSLVDGFGGSVAKPEQEKSVTITENGTVEVLPDDGKVLSKVSVNVEVESGGSDGSLIHSLIYRSITEYSDDELTEVAANAFNPCNKMTNFNCPNITKIGNYAFQECEKLQNISTPLVTSVGIQAFARCYKLESIYLPLCKTVGAAVFSACNVMTIGDFGVLTSLATNTFQHCYSLKTVILRSETMVTMANINAFQNCYHFYGTTNATMNPNGLQDGYVYVPRSLIESYKVATNWATLYASHPNVFRALEDYTVDGTITGALDESKI